MRQNAIHIQPPLHTHDMEQDLKQAVVLLPHATTLKQPDHRSSLLLVRP